MESMGRLAEQKTESEVRIMPSFNFWAAILLILTILTGLVELQTLTQAAATREQAQQAIDEASRSIITGDQAGEDTTLASKLLGQSVDAFANREYDTALTYANDARDLIGVSPIELGEGSWTVKPVFVGTVIVMVAGFVGVSYFRKRITRGKRVLK